MQGNCALAVAATRSLASWIAWQAALRGGTGGPASTTATGALASGACVTTDAEADAASAETSVPPSTTASLEKQARIVAPAHQIAAITAKAMTKPRTRSRGFVAI